MPQLSELERPDAVPTTAQFGQMVAGLAKAGLASQAAQEVIGNKPSGRTRAEICAQLIVWLKERPKGAK